MTLLARTTARRRMTATIENRARVERVERRADEIALVAEVETDYQRADRAGDLQIEGHFQALYQLVDSEAEKEAVARAFAVWQRTERAEEQVVSGSVDEATQLLRENNPYWLHDGCGPDGQAA